MSELKDRLASLADDERSEILARLAARKSTQRPSRFPLSSPQQRLWILHQMGGDISAYCIPTALRIRGLLNIESLAGAFSEVTRRHEVLRTRFEADETTGVPEQVIVAWSPFCIEVTDLTSFPAGARDREAIRLAGKEIGIPFNLATGPLLRARLLKLGSEDHILVLTMHHIVCDGWSSSVLTRELVTIYGAYSRGDRSPLPELPIQYADYASWQRKSLNGELIDAQLSYWRERFREPPPPLDLPLRGPRPALQSTRGSQITQQMGRELTSQLRRLGNRQEATLFMILLAAFKCLLYRYTSQEDIAIGTPIANRHRRQVESLIGLFINTLVLRTDLSGNPPFATLLGRVKEVALGAYANQDVPFDKLVEEIVTQRDPSRTPLFQIMFALQNAPGLEARLGNLSIVPLSIDVNVAKFDLTVSIVETDQGMTAVWEYNTDLFDLQTIQRMMGHYERLLAAIALDPLERLSQLNMLSDEEARQLLGSAEASASSEVAPALLHEWLEAQVGRTPDAIALVCGSEHLTYDELNVRANKLGHYLIALGVGPESRVGIWVERTPKLVIALLGVLKSGAAYVPLDPAYPKDRLDYVVRDARIRVLLTEQQLCSSAPGPEIPLVSIDGEWGAIELGSAENPRVGVLSGNIAYAIYTSGSMGKPKGVAVCHEQVTRLFTATEDWYGFKETDVWTLFHSYAFDFSVWEIWGALLYGGRLVVVPYLLTRSPHAFYELTCAERVTVLNQTPSAFRQFMQAEQDLGGAPGLALRHVIFGGEALDLESLRPWFNQHPENEPRLINMYGITETTVHVTYRPLTAADSLHSRGSLIGRPIPDLQVYVTDRDTQLVPFEVPGEIYVGGAGLARCYLDKPELTAERFIPDPFSGPPGARLYKAGDSSRVLPNGDREYLGRVDHQVKIRGFRIEPGEIEATLHTHPSVKNAVVVIKEDGAGEKRLVAYVVPDPESAPGVDELRRCLRERLPDYMIPAAFVYVDAFPLTSNGKLDRRALPEPDQSQGLNRDVMAPRDVLEFQIAQIWEETFRTGPIGVTDDFFELGGHSMLAVRLTARMKAKLNAEVPLSALVRGGTIESLACFLRNKQESQKASPLVPIQTGGERTPFFCVHPIGGNVLCYVDLSRHLGNDQPFYAFQATALNNGHPPEKRVEEMAAEYIEAMRAVQPRGPFRLGGWSFGGLVAAEMARQLQGGRDQVEILVLIDSRVPGNDTDSIYSSSEEDALETVAAFLADLSGLSGKQWVDALPINKGASAEDLMQLILADARDRRIIPPSVEVSEISRLFEIFQCNLMAARSYKPCLKWLPEQTILIRSTSLEGDGPQDGALGWDEFATGRLVVREVSGTHYSMLRKPQVAALAGILRELM